MSLGSYLATADNLKVVGKNSWKFGRPKIMDLGCRYYDEHPDDLAQIVKNLGDMGLPSTGAALDRVVDGIVAHYYEKLFILTKSYEAYWIALNRVDVGDSMRHFEEARDTGKAVFVGQSHFGATYLMGSVLMSRGVPLNMVGKFPEPVGTMLIEGAKVLCERYGAAQVNFLNLAQPGVDVPGEMLRFLMTKKIVSNVFDENNQFCKPVTLLGKTLMGGTGMDQILRSFNDERVMLLTPFLVRTSDETFRYEIDRHYFSGGDIIKSFYKSLEKRIKAHPDQWYFIHEVHESFEDLRK